MRGIEETLIEVAMYGMEGYITFIKPGITPCLACLFPSPPRWSIPFPVLGSVSAMMGCIAATEAVKYITGYGSILEGWMLHIDTRNWEVRKVRVKRKLNCLVCEDIVV
jgi:molybdopterin/thiamine biosynthesis adenylyltransferase